MALAVIAAQSLQSIDVAVEKAALQSPQKSGLSNALEPTAYLESTVFPVLLPGIEKLLKGVKKKDSSDNDAEDDVLVNGVHPIAWLAQYLFRRNNRTSVISTPTVGNAKDHVPRSAAKPETIQPSTPGL